MKSKVLINARKKRRIPKHFSWVDHRLVRDNHLRQCSTDALALYLFLVTVGDHEGLSYYSDGKISRYLNFSSSPDIISPRKELLDAGLIAYCEGIYQILDLAPEYSPNLISKGANKDSSAAASGSIGGESIASVIARMFGEK